MALRQRLTRWGLGLLVNALWALAMLAALVTLLLLLATRRYGFVWETTLLSGDAFVALTHLLGALPALAEGPLNVTTYGGAFARTVEEAYVKPFTEATGIKANMIAADDPATPLKAQVEAGNVTTDVVDIEYPDAIRLCDEGLIEPIDPAILPAAADGTAAAPPARS